MENLEDMFKDSHRIFYKIEYAPISVRNILIKMKNLASLMVGLAYYSVLYGDRKLAKEVHNLEELVDFLNLQLIMQASLATRSANDAKRIISIFRLASAVDKISNAAADIASVALVKGGSQLVGSALLASKDVIARVKIRQGSNIIGRSLKDVHKILDVAFDVIAVRRDMRWILEPKADYTLNLNDVLIVRGTLESIKALKEVAKDYEEYPRELEKPPKAIITGLLKLKEVSELMVYLAYMSIMTKSIEIAKHVLSLEDYVDNLYVKYMVESIRSSSDISSEDLVSLLRIATATEMIADAAAEMAEIIIRGLEPHPILSDVLQEGLERILIIKAPKSLDGLKIGDLKLSNYSAFILAIKRNNEWIINPSNDEVVQGDDVLLIRCYEESRKQVLEKLMVKGQ
ncbi:MAG: hypothetical protein DRJ66_01620 [Thermoprotei archaeon]|nr:MAG: hypothetical protein DRJ66_01620 [Thermoprotei archaeon]RLF17937.1 MAG: hypothetical protein DRZ82_09160 [Thermoprotei archaeon]